MLYRALADLVVVFHLAFIVFIVAGGLFALRWWWLPLVHIPAALWGLYIELSGGYLPHADKKQMPVIRANGQAMSISTTKAGRGKLVLI